MAGSPTGRKIRARLEKRLCIACGKSPCACKNTQHVRKARELARVEAAILEGTRSELPWAAVFVLDDEHALPRIEIQVGGLIPLSDASRRPARLPVVTAFIIAVNVFVFLLELMRGDAPARNSRPGCDGVNSNAATNHRLVIRKRAQGKTNVRREVGVSLAQVFSASQPAWRSGKECKDSLLPGLREKS